MVKNLLFLIFLLSFCIYGEENNYPYLIISNGKIKVKIYLPDKNRGYCRNARFDWSGVVGKVEFKNHKIFGEWITPYNPESINGGTGTVEEFGMGTDGMSAPVGFYEAKEGEGFIKIGVGVLKKEGEKYFFGRNYRFIKYGNWKIRKGKNFVEFRQRLKYGKYGYFYTKKIVIPPGKEEFYIYHKLKNTGLLPINQTVYCHNFTIIDDVPVGPSYSLKLFFHPKAKRDLRGIVEIEGNKITFKKSFKKAIFTELEGYKGLVKENHFIIFNRKTKAGMEVKGTLPLYRFHFFAVPGSICPEPFVKIIIKPGEEISWKNTYKFFTENGNE